MALPHHINLSVIIPTKNRPHLLKRALLSVAAHSYPSVEVCVVDNNTDDSVRNQVREIVSDVEKNTPRFRWIYIHSSKPYASGARNDGMAATQGEYIAFLDDDDEFLADSLSIRMQEMLADPELALLYCAGYSSIYPYPLRMYRYYHYNRKLHQDKLMMMSCSSIMISRHIFEKHHLYFDEHLSRMEDYDLCRDVIRLGLKVKSIPLPLVHIHLHPDTRLSSRKLNDYSFMNQLVSRWGPGARDVVFSYAEGVHIWRRCFGIEDQRLKEIIQSIKTDFNRNPTFVFRLKYMMVSVSPHLLLAF
jgi:glycosyltransferase involved in cell wall biosynthesis